MASSATLPPRGAGDVFTPAEIAGNDVLTTREKLELLRHLRAELTGEHANPGAVGFDIGAIDRAIEDVRRRAREGTEQPFRLDR